MELYSYKNQDPTELPFRIVLNDGSTRTSLNELSNEELKSLGFTGPIIKPDYDDQIQKIVWNGNSFDIINLTQEEIQLKVSERESQRNGDKLDNIDYHLFWIKLLSSKVYKKLRTASSQFLEMNVLCTEFISIINDAKIGIVLHGKIQEYINILFLKVEFTLEEVEELQRILNETNLDVLYTLPNEAYISSHTYSIEFNSIIGPKPYDGAILENGIWTAPLPYPTDGKNYQWDDTINNWTEIYY